MSIETAMIILISIEVITLVIMLGNLLKLKFDYLKTENMQLKELLKLERSRLKLHLEYEKFLAEIKKL